MAAWQTLTGGAAMRQAWLDASERIAGPVLRALAAGRLREALPGDFHPDRADYMHLEALGRTLCGLAPWLELEGLTGPEGTRQAHCRALARQALRMGVDPASPDRMNFTRGYGQALVDAAFLAHAIVRAPVQLGACLEDAARAMLLEALRATRRFTPFVSNWLLFSAMVEAALQVLGAPDADLTRVDYAVNMLESWYLGDGVYGDGPAFHADYYNSFVIHPMLVDVLRVFRQAGRGYEEKLQTALGRAGRYAALLERLIAPDGSYPILGRSVTYRFGAFQLLAQAALEGFLPPETPPAQVRCALHAVIGRVMAAPGLLDAAGWLQPGVCGRQEGLAEGYISVGSLYLCMSAFLPLGLPPQDPFWAAPDRPWTARRLWQGEDLPCDHALEG